MMKKVSHSTYRIMKAFCSILVLLLLGASVAVAADDYHPKPAVPGASAQTKWTQPAKSDMDALTCIFTRRSVRKYTSQPVSDDTIKILLQAAMSAPTARDERSWEFIVIRDKEILRQVPSFHPFAKHIPDAPVAIVIVGNKKLEAQPGLWVADCSNAAMTILLAAHSMGLGAVWTTFYPYLDRMAGIRKLLNLPDNIEPLNIIPMGYPAEKKGPESRLNPAKIHYDRW